MPDATGVVTVLVVDDRPEMAELVAEDFSQRRF
jgi:hypothetical protein